MHISLSVHYKLRTIAILQKTLLSSSGMWITQLCKAETLLGSIIPHLGTGGTYQQQV